MDMIDTSIHHPIAIVEDRYSGVYSGGRWLALSEADRMHEGQSRVDYVVSDRHSGPHGDDLEAMAFWANPPDWIAVGDTPQAALDHLIEGAKAAPFGRKHNDA